MDRELASLHRGAREERRRMLEHDPAPDPQRDRVGVAGDPTPDAEYRDEPPAHEPPEGDTTDEASVHGQAGEVWTADDGGTLAVVCEWPGDDPGDCDGEVTVVRLLQFGRDSAGEITTLAPSAFDRMVGYLHDLEREFGALDLPLEARARLDENVTYDPYHEQRENDD